MSRGPRAWVVVGMGFGDEGKGLATDYLCGQHPNALVIRYNGGHQAGHTVTTATGQRHIFSSFGAGTLRGAPTFWAKYCTFSPAAVLPEYRALLALGVQPRLLVDGRCPVTTHYDVLYNRALEADRGADRHGSCGLGFGATVARHHASPLRLCAHDLLTPLVWQHKLAQIRAHYRQKISQETALLFDELDHNAADQRFAEYVAELVALHHAGPIRLVAAPAVLGPTAGYDTLVFEGAQGLLLDAEAGLFPHVTRSHTTSRNALKILAKHWPALPAAPELLYVTRAYHTRHGAGPLPDEGRAALPHFRDDTNQPNPHQGTFRRAPLHLALAHHALRAEAAFAHGLPRHLLVTCLDHLAADELVYTAHEQVQVAPVGALPSLLGGTWASTWASRGPTAANIAPLPLLS